MLNQQECIPKQNKLGHVHPCITNKYSIIFFPRNEPAGELPLTLKRRRAWTGKIHSYVQPQQEDQSGQATTANSEQEKSTTLFIFQM